MREVALTGSESSPEAASFAACVATILELDLAALPEPTTDPADGWGLRRWLGGLGLGLVPIADVAQFSWAGPFVGWLRGPAGERRAAVLFGVPPGVVWDPAGEIGEDWDLDHGVVIAALDVALAMPPLPEAPAASGRVEAIYVAPDAGAPPQAPASVRALAGRGLAGDRHADGRGTFPSGVSGSALTLIEAEVCESFDPPLAPAEHRRNLVTRGVDLNALVGHEFVVGGVRCRGMRLCEPCTVLQRYASRPLLRELVHRGGLRADILEDGDVRVGDAVGPLGSAP